MAFDGIVKTRRGEVRGDAVTLHVQRGDQARDLIIDGKALVSQRGSRMYRFDEHFTRSPLALQVEATAGRIFPRGDSLRADAASGYALARELEYVSAVIAQQPLSDLTFATAFPMAVDQPQPYQEVYSWKQQTWTTGGRLSRSYKDIGTRGDIQVAKNSQNVAPLIGHASWGLDDIARASLGNIPLPALELQGAMRFISETVNSEGWFGDSAEGIAGLYDNADITKSVVPNGAGGSPLWANKTPDEIEADITALIVAVVEAVKGKGNLLPNRLAMSTASYMKIATTARSQLTSETILQFAQQALAAAGGPGAMITSHPELADNGSGSKFMICYRYDAQVAGRILPVAPVFLPPDIESTMITQAIHAQSGGLNVRFPVAIQIRYGM